MSRIPWQLRFVGLVLIWGSSFALIKVALRGFEPFQVAFIRCVLGIAVIGAVLLLRGERLPRERIVWAHLAVAGLVLNAIPFALFSWAETRVPSLVAGVANAAAPLATLAVACVLIPEERPTARRLAGFALGLVGVLVLFGAWSIHLTSALGELAVLGATISYGVGYPYVRRFLSPRGLPVAALATGQLVCATLWLAPRMPVAERPGGIPAASVVALLTLGVVGTGIAYLLIHSLIRDRSATTASLINYPIPAVAVVLGVVFLGEPLFWYQPVGAAIVLAGVAVAEGARARRGVPVA